MNRAKALCLLLLFPLQAMAEHAPKTLHLGCVEWPPYISRSLPDQGYLADISRLITQQANIDLNVEIKPWKRVVKEVSDGRLDGSVCMFKTSERQKLMHFVEPPILMEKTVLFHRDDYKPEVHSLEDLSQIRLGILDGAGYQSDSYLRSHPNLVHVSSIDSLFRMLAKGRVDLILAEYRNGMSIIEKTPIVEGHRFGVLPVNYQITDVYIVLSKARTDSRHLAAELSRIAEKVLVSSEAKTLREKHHIFELPETESLVR